MSDLNNVKGKDTEKWFFFTLLYLVVDYGRPEDILPVSFMRLGLLTIVILTYFIFFKKKNPGKSKQIRMLWYFIILLAAYIPFARNNYWAYQTTENMLVYMPFILSAIICVDSIDRLKKIINVFIVLMIYISIYSLFHAGKGSGNYFHDENDVSLFIDMWLPFCFFLFMYEKNFKKRLLYALGIAAGLTAVVVSFSRGGFVGLVCATFVTWLFSDKKILSLIIICLLGMGIYLSSGQRYKTEMDTVTDEHEGTAQERLLSWASAWDMFLDNPLGVGGNNFQTRFPEYQGNRFSKSMWGRVAHSLWFTLIPELGIFGIIIYFRLLFYNIKDTFILKGIDVNNNPDLKYLHALSLSFLASLAGFFAAASFISVLYYPHYWYLTAIIVASKNISTLYIKR